MLTPYNQLLLLTVNVSTSLLIDSLIGYGTEGHFQKEQYSVPNTHESFATSRFTRGQDENLNPPRTETDENFFKTSHL